MLHHEGMCISWSWTYRSYFSLFIFCLIAGSPGIALAEPTAHPTGVCEKLSLKISERNSVVRSLMAYARSQDAQKENIADFLALSLALEPNNKEAMLVSYQIEKNILEPAKKTPELDNAANNLVRVADKLKADPSKEAQLVAVHLYDAANRIDPSNSLAPLELAELRKSVELNWELFYTPTSYRATGDGATATAADGGKKTTPSATPPPLSSKEAKSAAHAPAKSIAKVNGLVVIDLGQHKFHGRVLEIIATQTRPDGSRGSASFTNKNIGPMMLASASEVYRALIANHRQWTPISVKFSFDEQYSVKDGPSASTAFGLLITSLEEGIDLDSGVAVTGDMSADLVVRPIGGVSAKILGAQNSGCFAVGVPVSNARDVVDALLLDHSNRLITQIQVYTLEKLDDALDLVRTDRPKELQDAMNEFKALIPTIGAPGSLTDPQIAKLQSILKKAPNNLSARLLLAQNQRELPMTVSLRTSLEILSDVAEPYTQCLKQGVIVSFPTNIYKESLDRLDLLKPVADKDAVPFINRFQNIIRLWNSADYHRKEHVGATGRDELTSIAQDFESFRNDFIKLLNDENHASELHD